MPDLLLIDNYDSFTYNVFHLCHEAFSARFERPGDIRVVRNDEIDLSDIADLAPQAIVISPGPGTPDESGITLDVISRFGGQIPMLGICLGMQAMAQSRGAQVVRGTPVHGKKSRITVDTSHRLFAGLPSAFDVVRYHSLHVPKASLVNTDITPLAWTDDGILMAMEASDGMWGVQFHPESIGSLYGRQLLDNFYMTAWKDATEPILNSASSPCSRL